jgi:S1-C subfamily serine protease
LRALGPDSVGQTVTLGLRRGGETKNVALTIAERPTT